MSPDDETVKLDAPWPFGPWAHKNLELIKELLDKGANPNEPGLDGHPHIHIASLMDNKEILKLLLDHGANVDSTDPSQNTALHMASVENNVHIFYLMPCNTLCDQQFDHRTALKFGLM